MAINVDTYTGHTWVDNSTPDLEAEVLNDIEEGIRKNNTAIKAVLSALVSQITNDPDKFASMAALYAVNQNLGTLSTTVTNINSNLALKASQSDLNTTNTNFAKYNMEYHARIYLTSGYISGMVSDKIFQGYKGGDIALSSYAPPDTYNGNQYGIIQWTLVTSDIAHLQFLAPRSSAIITRAISASESYDSGWIAH